MKILQLLDHSVFLPNIIRSFSAFENVDVENVILIGCDQSETSAQSISSDNVYAPIIVKEESEAYRQLLVEPFDFIWVHFRTSAKEKFLLKRESYSIVIWSTWGADLYSLVGNWLYGRRTSVVHLRSLPPLSICYDLVTYILHALHLNRFLWHSETRAFVKSVLWFSTVVPEEGKLFVRYVNRKARFLRYNYLPEKEDEADYTAVTIDRKGIWVGNSATYTNNHFDVLHAIRNLRGYTITAPLSYGDTVLARKVAQLGKRLFGDLFCPIFDFYDYKTFVSRMAEHSVFIFGHFRQQAAGNIRIAIKLGGCVFLSKRNPVFHMLIREGFVVYPLEDLSRLEAISEKFFANHQHDNLEKAARWATRESLVKENCGTIQSLLDLSAKHQASRL